MNALVIPADPAMPVVVKEIAAGLEALQQAVGGWIASVDIPGLTKVVAWADDEGMIKGKAYNMRAALLAGQDLVGDIVVTGYNPRNGENTELPLDLIEAIRKAL